MRKLLWFFTGVLMLASMLGLLFFAGAIYDAESKYTIETFFWEPDAAADARVSVPVSATDMPESFLREQLIARFVNEYFYVIPDVENANMRAEFRNTDGTLTALRIMSYSSVRNNWQKNVAPEIQDLATNGAMRQVEVLGISQAETGHLVVNYRLKTWTEPNNVLAAPVVTVGNLYMDVTPDPVTVLQTQDVLDGLLHGLDPVYAFTFRITDMPQQ